MDIKNSLTTLICGNINEHSSRKNVYTYLFSYIFLNSVVKQNKIKHERKELYINRATNNMIIIKVSKCILRLTRLDFPSYKFHFHLEH